MSRSKSGKNRKQGKNNDKALTVASKAGGKQAALEGVALAPEEKNKAGEEEGDEGIPVNLDDYKGARKKLRHAVKAVVKVKSATIARKLVSRVEQGDMRGTEMMLSLIEKRKQDKDAKKNKRREGPSWAELLASEPEHDPSTDDRGSALTVVSGK